MSKLNMYAVRDKVANVYHPPQCCLNHPHAIRTFQQIFNKTESIFYQYADDFEVMFVACFDDVTGKVTVCEHVAIAQGLELVQKSMHSETTEKKPERGKKGQ